VGTPRSREDESIHAFAQKLLVDDRDAEAPEPQNPSMASTRRSRVNGNRRWAIPTVLLLAILVGGSVVKGREFRRISIEGWAPSATVVQAEAARRAAEALRDEAAGWCEQGSWLGCQERLDRARNLDPGGEREPWVQRMREDIDWANRPATKQIGSP
jgi:hypothetical protein